MSPAITVLSALTNPATQNAAFMLLEISVSAMKLIADLDKPDMTDEEKRRAWADIKKLNAEADAMLNAAIESHPAWRDDPDVPAQES